MDLNNFVVRADIASALASTSNLATLYVAKWSARMTDRVATAQLTRNAEASPGVASVKRQLMTGKQPELASLRQICDEARKVHKRLTLPWELLVGQRKGDRLLPANLAVAYIQKMGRIEDEFVERRNKFLSVYEEAVESALLEQGRLNGEMGEEISYPSKASIEKAFEIRWELLPIPVGSVNLPEGMETAAQKLSEQLEDRIRETAGRAQEAVAKRVATVVQHFVEIIGKKLNGETRVRATLIDEIKELGASVRAFDLFGDPRITAIADQVEALAGSIDLIDMREHEGAQREAVTKAATILNQLAEWGVTPGEEDDDEV